MLVVMMVLLMGTVGATIALDAASNGLRSAGHARTGVQTRHMAEAIVLSAVAYIDVIGGQRFHAELIDGWAGRVPRMFGFGEPSVIQTPPLPGYTVGVGEHHAARLFDEAMCQNQAPDEAPPAQIAMQDGDPVPGEGCSPDIFDRTGTMGPGNAWVPHRFVVDITDCQRVTEGIEGTQHGQSKAMRCVLTARGRTYVPSSPTETWNMADDDKDYMQHTHQAAHDAQMVIITPELPSPGGSGNL